jgi:hypothetical protein
MRNKLTQINFLKYFFEVKDLDLEKCPNFLYNDHKVLDLLCYHTKYQTLFQKNLHKIFFFKIIKKSNFGAL